MTGFERPRADRATAGADETPPGTARNRAIALIDEGNALEEQGRISEAMARYDAAVQADPRCARAHLNRGNILLEGGRLDEARGAYQLAVACDPRYAAAHFNLANLHYRAGEFGLALSGYRAAVDIRPDFVDAFVAMANALDSMGRADEAVECYERALAIRPDYAEAHFNLGVLETARGRHAQALRRYLHAVQIKPDFARAHQHLGVLQGELQQLDAAEASLRRALSIEPESAEILHDLAAILLARGRSPEGVRLLLPRLADTAPWAIKAAFANCVARTKFTSDDALVRAALTAAILEPWGMPHELCRPALDLIMLDEGVADCVRRADASWPARVPTAELFTADGLAALAGDYLLHAVLETVPVSSIEFERFLTCARRALLEAALRDEAPDSSQIDALPFYSALARQCFVNEYVFALDDGERTSAAAARAKLIALLDAKAMVPPLLTLAVAAYFPLGGLPDPGSLLAANRAGPIEGVLRQQICEPLEEQALRSGIACLTSITSGVSAAVRDQYEHNPYPRWVKLPIHPQPPGFNDEMRLAFPLASFTPLPDDTSPEMLVAGCGTGSQSILVARRYRGVRVLAIDLSLSSIGYAKRKTRELGIANVEYAQADILELGSIDRTFDIIESVGVLHHLADPFAGWRILLSRLRPGGFMGLGFYSEIARRHVVRAREWIADLGYADTAEDIRRFRQDLSARRASAEFEWLSKIQDFYSTSECRDLLFHVQEHRLTLDQIEAFLSESGLRFLGFKLDPRVLHRYRARFRDDPSCTNLRNWARFETDNPDTFVGMYRFCAQLPR